MINTTAILFFSRTAAAEAKHKQVVKPYKTNKKIYTSLIANTKNILNNTGLPYFICDEKQQKATSFSQKLSDGIAAVFLKGYNNVIVVGNDCPQLNVASITSAADSLKTHDVVLGPSHNGGVYLIGMSKKTFYAVDFNKINWQTSSVFKDLKNITSSFVGKYLPVLAEVNTGYDLIQAKKYFRQPDSRTHKKPLNEKSWAPSSPAMRVS